MVKRTARGIGTGMVGEPDAGLHHEGDRDLNGGGTGMRACTTRKIGTGMVRGTTMRVYTTGKIGTGMVGGNPMPVYTTRKIEIAMVRGIGRGIGNGMAGPRCGSAPRGESGSRW